jgi:hypothetical protein
MNRTNQCRVGLVPPIYKRMTSMKVGQAPYYDSAHYTGMKAIIAFLQILSEYNLSQFTGIFLTKNKASYRKNT